MGSERDDALMQRAQRRMSMQALALQQMFTPMDAAGLLIGAAVGVLETEYGRHKAAEYVEGLAREMRGKGDSDEAPTMN